MNATTLTLTDFLLARIVEDEEVTNDWPIDGEWGLHSPGLMWVDGRGHPIYAPRARVLAECEAKRRIVEHADAEARCGQHLDNSDDDCDECVGAWRINMNDEWYLRFLAFPYANHPDYREEWRA